MTWFGLLITLVIIFTLVWWTTATIMGLILCRESNAFGIIILFITMNILGLLIGITIFYISNKKLKELQNTIFMETDNNVIR